MTSLNLTRDEAQQRSRQIKVHNYKVALDLTVSEKFFTSHTVVDFEVREGQQADTFLDLRADEIVELFIDGAEKPTDYDAEHGIPLQGLEPGRHSVDVTARIPYSRTGQGLHRFVDPADDRVYLYSQCETADAKRILACFDQPDMKATYDFSITAPHDWTVITNETSTVTDNGDSREWNSRIGYQLSTYLIAVCAGHYYQVSDEWTGTLTAHPETSEEEREITVPLALFCRQSLAKHLDAERLFTETKQGFDFYHRNFGIAYPFGKYDQVLCPEFNMGAMENAGCVTHRDEFVFHNKATHYQYERRADTFLHEMAHMWFGDLVTMQWWDDLWLNESFATWASAISQAEETQYDTAWVTFANIEKSWAYQQDQLPTTHPISTDASDIETVEQNFDGITYAKGASVLKQLQAYVGREEFFAGVRRHFEAHKFGNATFEDLLGHLEDASGRDLSWWAQQWLKTTGVNTLAARTEDDGKAYTSFAVHQAGETLRTHRIAVGLYRFDEQSQKVVRTKRVELDIDGEFTNVDELVGTPVADLVLVNDDDLTYCLPELDERSLATLLQHIDKIADPMARTLCWSAAWEMTRDGSLKARDFVQLVARGAQAETEMAVLERITGQAVTALTAYADQDWAKAEGAQLLGEAFQAAAENGSEDRALIFIKTLSHLPLVDSTRAYLQNILDNDEDAGLRWKALTALAADGAIGEEAAIREKIAQQRELDKTSSGAQAALQVEAAINSDENKKRIWDELRTGELGNLEARFKMLGLTFTGSAKHLEQFNEAYFADAQKVWAEFSPEMALAVLTGTYPTWDKTEEGLQRADDFLAGDIPAGLRRLVLEGRDRTARALRNQRIDRGE
ncbi:aminopeptidase N [Corynebacterium pseudodiphtheriticum]|uniref:aminopeptidase N n=1 Tax=Corynebacterium pseudodiphtheriticum TaxID=37637 RepID=UPI00254068E1|nr:aminopeptidase N [Corynebacterium pseudodiphtheriticum]MDK4274258.1 aminopeptidase N [Corynebacterium pseudodiphtheriticum]